MRVGFARLFVALGMISAWGFARAQNAVEQPMGQNTLGKVSLGQAPLSRGPAVSRGEDKNLSVPEAPPVTATVQAFHDKHFGVRFEVPPGWDFVQKDKQVSTFHLDARTAAEKSQMRGVASMDFNPFPLSTFSGALFYYSVQKHTSEHECALEAYSSGSATRAPEEIGGMEFLHGHDEQGKSCVEQRDEVYTAYRRGSCYRFDLAVNTFCAQSSGAQEMTVKQYEEIEKKMTGILDSVVLDWRPAQTVPKPGPDRRVLPLNPEERAPAKAAAFR